MGFAMRRWVWLAVAAVVLIAGGIFFGSPYLAAHNLQTIANSGDVDKLEAVVDFPSVRESLKSQISAAMTKRMASDPSLEESPFAALGLLMVPAIVEKAVDTYVTPDGVAAMVRGAEPGEEQNNQTSGVKGENPDISYSHEWLGMDRFRVKMANAKTLEAGPAMLFERRGLISWKLVKIDISESFLKD